MYRNLHFVKIKYNINNNRNNNSEVLGHNKHNNKQKQQP